MNQVTKNSRRARWLWSHLVCWLLRMGIRVLIGSGLGIRTWRTVVCWVMREGVWVLEKGYWWGWLEDIYLKKHWFLIIIDPTQTWVHLTVTRIVSVGFFSFVCHNIHYQCTIITTFFCSQSRRKDSAQPSQKKKDVHTSSYSRVTLLVQGLLRVCNSCLCHIFGFCHNYSSKRLHSNKNVDEKEKKSGYLDESMNFEATHHRSDKSFCSTRPEKNQTSSSISTNKSLIFESNLKNIVVYQKGFPKKFPT